MFGQGAGGTFYQAFDVTLDGIEQLRSRPIPTR